jgi:NDP-sugar pyrophosphorylase family protein
MKAMILAAGHGERMLPLTMTIPKPVIPVLGRPMIEQIILRLAGSGYDHVAVNLHHLPDKVVRLLENREDLGLKDLYLSPEPALLGTAGGVRGAEEFLRGSGTILVRNSDFLSDIDLEAAARTHLLSGCPVTLVLAAARTGYTPVPVDRDGRILGFGDDPPCDPSRIAARYLFTGLQFVEEEVLDRIPPGGPRDLVRDVYRDLASSGSVASHIHEGFWWEFGTPEAYLQGSLEMLGMEPERLRAIAETDPVKEFEEAWVAMGAAAQVFPNTRLLGRVALGMTTLVGEEAVIEDSVIMAESWIGPGSRLRNCIIGPGVEIPSGTTLTGTLVAADADGGIHTRRLRS